MVSFLGPLPKCAIFNVFSNETGLTPDLGTARGGSKIGGQIRPRTTKTGGQGGLYAWAGPGWWPSQFGTKNAQPVAKPAKNCKKVAKSTSISKNGALNAAPKTGVSQFSTEIHKCENFEALLIPKRGVSVLALVFPIQNTPFSRK